MPATPQELQVIKNKMSDAADLVVRAQKAVVQKAVQMGRLNEIEQRAAAKLVNLQEELTAATEA